ncbi:right-handed parallel beta-helix repeat-containing protein [uncultured Aquimarina sp.]|uniref:right-handed parallel beta-helix repeat-containing protein n=1 Tax=uncultured Aquimarina sp. TaxID=575652 RepID=UPI002634775B|nr:right-handed parallel beta-helix repeat-containing protein [uncultured Aquimarina sp.]
MKYKSLLIIFFLQTFLFYAQIKKIYVSDLNGDDSVLLASQPTIAKTLKGAYDLIPDPVDKEYHIVLKKEGNVSLGTNDLISFTWTKSGTSDYPIKIYSEEERVVITRPSGNAVDIIKFRNVQYIHVSNITFENVTHGFIFDNVDHSSIKYCEFIGDILDNHNYGGALWIGKDIGSNLYSPNEYATNSNYKSEYNEIAYNYIHSQKVNNHCHSHQHHGFYISHGTDHNKFIGNTFDKPLGSGIQMNHGYQENNTIANNFIYKEFYQPLDSDFFCPDPKTGIDESDPNIPSDNAYDKINNSKFGMILSYEDENEQTGTLINNDIVGNYVYLNDNFGISSANTYSGNRFIAWEHEEMNNNNNVEFNKNYENNEISPKDPYWLSFDLDNITARVISGDFNGDGKDDTAAFYDIKGTETQIFGYGYRQIRILFINPIQVGGKRLMEDIM